MTDHFSAAKAARWFPVVIGAVAFVLYLLTAAPSIVELFDDSLEFQLVGPTLGIAHPTGYPLYVLLGGVWSRLLLPVGNWAWRMNVLSALFGAVAVALLFALTRRLVTRTDGRPNQWAGLAAALAFGLGSVWWSQATIAEVYALHVALMAAILNVAIGINGAVGRGPSFSKVFDRRMTWLCLLIGLGLAHHRTTVLLIPGLLIYLLWSVPGLWRPRRVWVQWATTLAAPLLLYLFIPLRATMGVADLNASYVNSWNGFWRHVLASGYAGFFAESDLTVARTASDWLSMARSQVGVLGMVLALLGLAWLVDRNGRPAKAWFLILIVLAANLLFALSYRVHDVEVFLLPVFFCMAIFGGGGVGLLGRPLESRTGWASMAEALLVVALGVSVWIRAPAVDRSHDWASHDYAVALAKVDFPEGSHVVGLEGEMTALKYMQQAEGLGLSATPVVADDPGVRREVIEKLVEAGVPTYVTRELPGIEIQYSFTGDGELVRVWPRGQSQAAEPGHMLDVPLLDDAMTIEGVDLVLSERVGGPTLQIVYYWRPHRQIDRNLKLSLRLLGPSGEPVTGPDGLPVMRDEFPIRQAAMTSHWQPGEQVSDVHYIPVPAEKLEQVAILETIVYDASTVEEVARWQTDLRTVVGGE